MVKQIRKLGSGGFGEVHEVERENGEIVARKTYKPSNSSDQDEIALKARFRREVKYQSAISSPYVVAIVGHDLTADPPHFDMPLGSCSLADEMAKDRTLDSDPSQALFDILSGLDVLHSKGFAHRDLKPANVIKFEHADGGAHYALSDFGLINVGEAATSTLTQSNMAGGSPRWAAPECMISLKKATKLADIYSFGAILHDIFDGSPRLPFSELTTGGPIGQIVEKCTRKLPNRRYKSVGDLREELYVALASNTLTFASNEEQRVLSLLDAGPELSDAAWDEVFLFIDANDGDWQKNGNVFRSLLRDHLRSLAEKSPELFRAIGVEFCEYAGNGTFSFEFCDVIGGKAEVLYKLGDTDVKARAAVAMLRLGSSHNRWYIQRLFVRMSDKDIDDDLAERIAIEIEVMEIPFAARFAQTAEAINADKSELHPKIAELL